MESNAEIVIIKKMCLQNFLVKKRQIGWLKKDTQFATEITIKEKEYLQEILQLPQDPSPGRVPLDLPEQLF